MENSHGGTESQRCPVPQLVAQRSMAHLVSVLSFTTVINDVHANQESEAESLFPSSPPVKAWHG